MTESRILRLALRMIRKSFWAEDDRYGFDDPRLYPGEMPAELFERVPVPPSATILGTAVYREAASVYMDSLCLWPPSLTSTLPD